MNRFTASWFTTVQDVTVNFGISAVVFSLQAVKASNMLSKSSEKMAFFTLSLPPLLLDVLEAGEVIFAQPFQTGGMEVSLHTHWRSRMLTQGFSNERSAHGS
jgi:hypothetical protein